MKVKKCMRRVFFLSLKKTLSTKLRLLYTLKQFIHTETIITIAQLYVVYS